MTDRCDACTAATLTLWWHDATDTDLALCSHHSDHHAHALVAAGWQLLVDDREAAVMPDLVCTVDPTSH